MDIGLIAFVAFIIALMVFVYLKRDKIERQGLMIMGRTDKFKAQIKENALKYKTFWNIYFNIGIVVCFFTMIFGIIYLVSNALIIASGVSTFTFALVLPAPTTTFSIQPGLFLVPVWYWLIAVFVLMVPHEFAHALAFAINKIKIKSLGLVLFLILPGAFAEPDEKQLNKTRKWGKLQVFCAGSFSNIVTALIFIVLLNGFLVFAYTPNGIYYNFPTDVINKTDIQEINNLTSGMLEFKTANDTYILSPLFWKSQENQSEIIVYEDWPAARNNLSGTLIRIDETKIYNFEDVGDALSPKLPGDTVNILTSKGSYEITLAENNEKPFLGISTSYDPIINLLAPMNYRSYEIKNEYFAGAGNFLLTLFSFIIAICLGVAVINILPLKPLDGGYVLETLTNSEFAKWISVIMFFLVLYNFIGPLIPL